MKALSIKQPWAWLIVNGFKDIENRDWRYPPKFHGRFLVHAGKNIDLEMHLKITNFIAQREALNITGFLGIAAPTVERLILEYPISKGHEVGGIVGAATLTHVVTRSNSPWFTGPLGFALKDARPLPFVLMKGALGFFEAAYEEPA